MSSSSSSSSPAVAAASCPHLVGFHASAAGGPSNAIKAAVACGARSVAFFTRSNRSWSAPPLDPKEAAKFKALAAEHSFDLERSVLPHGTYLSNLGAPAESEIRAKSLEGVKDEMRRCAALGIRHYNFHPGSGTGGISRAAAVANVSAGINECHAAVPGVVLVVETMAAQGATVGSTLEELRDIIAGVEDKARVAVCIDTAHIWAANFDIRSPGGWDAYMARFDATVGLPYLRGMHLNDSKVALGSRKDRHEAIGCGCIGLEAFRVIMNDARLAGLPLILETPPEQPAAGAAGSKKAAKDRAEQAGYAREIKLLYSLVGTKAGDAVDPALLGTPSPGGGGGGGAGKKKDGKKKKGAAGGAGGSAGEDDDDDDDGEEEGDDDGDDSDGGKEGAAAATEEEAAGKKGKAAKAAKAPPAAAAKRGKAAAAVAVAAAPSAAAVEAAAPLPPTEVAAAAAPPAEPAAARKRKAAAPKAAPAPAAKAPARKRRGAAAAAADAAAAAAAAADEEGGGEAEGSSAAASATPASAGSEGPKGP